jgi:hypothetical protein
MKKHLTTDELVDKLYGVGADGHLNECEECSERFGQLRERREMVTQPLEASYEFLAAQRRDIYARLRFWWLPANLCIIRRRRWPSPKSWIRNYSPMYTRWSNRWSRWRRNRFMRCSIRISNNFLC